ncbi:MAG: hypothetical protein IPG62_14400 [Sphingomonadales bacterium]|nr:hypothetical protein [Sphingomonadales bacterium]
MAAHKDHIIDAGRPSEHLAARHRHSPVLETKPALTGITGEHPVGLGVQLQAGAGHRHLLTFRRAIPGFDQRHIDVGVFGQPRRKGCTG